MQKPMTGKRKQKGNPGEMPIRHGNKPIDGIVRIEVQHKFEEHNRYPGNVLIASRGKAQRHVYCKRLEVCTLQNSQVFRKSTHNKHCGRIQACKERKGNIKIYLDCILIASSGNSRAPCVPQAARYKHLQICKAFRKHTHNKHLQ